MLGFEHVETIFNDLRKIAKRQEEIMATLADVTAALAAQKTVLDQVVAEVTASAGSVTAAQLDAVVASINANTAEVQAVLPTGPTGGAPAPTGATGPTGS